MVEKRDQKFLLSIIFSISILGLAVTSCRSLESLIKPTPTFPYPLVGTVDHYSTRTNTPPPPTATSTMEPTATPTITVTPTLKPSTTPTITATKPTATVTATYLPSWLAPPLKDMQITWDDVAEYYDRTNTSLRYIEDFFEKDETYISDSSIEVSDGCLYDCSKQVWSTNAVLDIGFDNEEFYYFRKVVIFMLRSANEVTAVNLAENLFMEYEPFEYIYEPDEYRALNPPGGNTQVGIGKIESHDGLITVLATSRGSIALMVVNYVPPFSDDGGTELDIMSHFANIQLDTLFRSAIIP
jgi:hypothetical protein